MPASLATPQGSVRSRKSVSYRAVAAPTVFLHPLETPAPADPLEAELRRIGTSIAFARGRLAVEEGDPATYIFRVEAGALRVVRQLPDGRRCITTFLMPGDYFGLAESGVYRSSVEAITNARVVRYPRSTFDRLCEHNPYAGCRFLALVGQQLSAAQDRLVLVGQQSAYERLAAFLLWMAERSGDDGSLVALPMDRSDIADYLGLRIETVSRILAALRRRKVIDLPNFHSFVLLDRDALELVKRAEE